MTTATKREDSSRLRGVEVYGFLGLALLNIAVPRYWPGSVAATLINYVLLGGMTIAFAFRIRAGYLCRKPYWTRDSWLRYLRLAAMPVVAVFLVLFLSSFDMSSDVLGAPRSATRTVWVVVILGMMLLGVIGLIIAMDWLAKGEPSEQFTRTRWFQRRRAPG